MENNPKYFFPQEKKAVVFKAGHEECAEVIAAGISSGITLRQWYAGLAMQALLSRPDALPDGSVAEKAITCANYMMHFLSEQGEGGSDVKNQE